MKKEDFSLSHYKTEMFPQLKEKRRLRTERTDRKRPRKSDPLPKDCEYGTLCKAMGLLLLLFSEGIVILPMKLLIHRKGSMCDPFITAQLSRCSPLCPAITLLFDVSLSTMESQPIFLDCCLVAR